MRTSIVLIIGGGFLKKLIRVIDAGIKLFSGLAIITMISLVLYNAMLRYLFNSSMPASEEFARFAFIYTVFLGAIVAEIANSHVTVTALTDRLNKHAAVVVRIIREMLILGTLCFIFYGSIHYTMIVTRTTATNTPFWIITISLCIMVFAFLVSKLYRISIDVLDTIKKIRERRLN